MFVNFRFRHTSRMDIDVFQRTVQETINTLPPQFKAMLENVVVVIEPEAPVRRGRRILSLLGLYEGVPLTEWHREFSGKLPDKITLFQENIERYAESEDDVSRVIRETLLHEIGHHFGLDHDRIGKMEKRWRRKKG